MSRRNFTRNQKEEIVLRATDATGAVHCEKCGLALKRGAWEIDHILAEGLRPEADKQRKITIAEGQLLGKECCHRGEDGKTNRDVKLIAKGKRQNAKHIRIVTAPKMRGAPFPTSPKAAGRMAKDSLPPRSMFARLVRAPVNHEIQDGDYE